MRIKCVHGYFFFEETRAGQLSEFMSLTGFELASAGDHFTFEALIDAPTHSFLGGTFLGIPTIKTFEGGPWDVMRENKLVYNFALGLVVPILSVVGVAPISQTGNYYSSNGMIIPGAFTDEGLRITDYAAFFDYDRKTFRYSEVVVDAGI